jgi:hypothetical protein
MELGAAGPRTPLQAAEHNYVELEELWQQSLRAAATTAQEKLALTQAYQPLLESGVCHP